MNRISSSIGELKPHYTVVVVGSGYGGAIAASRLARAGRSVCLFERGREFLPGEYPDSELEALREFQLDLPAAHKGRPTGLYDFRINPDINVFLGCGLGGTSLVNANVTLEPEPRVLQDPKWPKALREDAAGLKAGFDRASAMLGANPYPDDFPPLAKLDALKTSSRHLQTAGAEKPPIAVTFKEGPNAAGVEQKPCILCGDCISGCNHSAKNTVLMNYLPDAKAFGAEIFTCVSVRRISRKDNCWQIHFRLQEMGVEAFSGPEQFITADHVVLSAGSLGSTEILLRSRDAGLPLSPQVGRHFTGNGDVLGFAYNCDTPIRGIGMGRRPVAPVAPVGPTITGVIDLRRKADLEEGLVIEEGSLPGALTGLMPTVFMLAAKAMGHDTDTGLADTLREKQREVESLVQGAYHGAVNHTQTFLVMAHDDGSGELVLENDRVRIKWPGVGRQKLFERINGLLREATQPLGGTYLPNPLWHPILGQDLITVHPLGGCIMADQAENGVVNHGGQVFDNTHGDTVHPGLYVLDGAVIPRSLGVNPLLTISALAERGAALIAGREGWKIDWSLGPPSQPQPPDPEKPGLRFTERMAGYLFLGEAQDFPEAEKKAKTADSPCEFILTIISEDLDTLLTDERHEARIIGTVRVPKLSEEPLSVSEGSFALFDKDPDQVDTRRMRYRMTLNAPDGRIYLFDGFKRIHQDRGLDLWSDTTTLFVTLSEKTAEKVSVIGKGVLHIAPDDLARQLGTFEVTGVSSPPTRLKYMARFGRFFGGTLFDVYGGIAARPSAFDPDAPLRKRRELRLRAPEIFDVITKDGAHLRLTRYRGGDKGPLLMVHGLGVSSRIFTMDTIDTTLAEYLYAHGYDLWLLDFRSSIELPASHTQYTGDDIALKDYPAAVDRVLAETGRGSLQALVHCFGATTFVMAMLAGLKGVRSALISQIATHIRAPLATRFKTGLHLPSILKSLGIESLTAYTDLHSNWREKLFDQMLRLQPVPFEERCKSPVCHRITFLYGTLYEHARLNAATHEALHEMFGVAGISALEHLATMVRKGFVVNAKGEDVYLPHLERLAIPITFIHGTENGCYHPESTALSYEALRRKNGDLYQRHVIAGYGHIDCIFGSEAVRDVYPLILQHFEQTGPKKDTP